MNLAKTSADKTQPIILPKWGTLFTYGNADVISIFSLESSSSIGCPLLGQANLALDS